MSNALQRLRGTRPVSWRTVVGLMLVPLTVAGVLLWGLWNPTERLDTMTAAVVNLDRPVEVDGQLVPMGRVLGAELIGGDAEANFTWVLTDEDDARAGLDDGRYVTVITIPENFSSAATSLSGGPAAAETATIDVQTSEQGRLLDPALSSIVTSTATRVLNEQLGAQFVGNIFVGFEELGAGIGEAADGASQLADGGSQLADGMSGLAAGTAELASGTAGLAGGASQLASGVSQLSGGASQLVSGANALSVGASDIAAGAQVAATGGAELAAGIQQYTDGINDTLVELQKGAGAAVAPLEQLYLDIDAGLVPLPPGLTLPELRLLIDSLAGAAADSPTNPITQLKGSGSALAAGSRASADGQQQLANGLSAYAGGVAQYASGVAAYAGGVTALAGGANELASGTAELATGTGDLAAGASQLADGARQSADGTASLADGLYEAAGSIPAYSADEREKLAGTAVAPVTAVGGSDELFNAAGVPLFAGIALWGGALAASMVLAPLWRRTREAARGVFTITVRSALPMIGIGAAQGALAGVALPFLLGYDMAQGLGFFGLALTAGVAFALVNQGLSALLGGFGRFIAFALLVIAFAIGVISTTPAVLQAIGDASPIGSLFAGFQAVIAGSGATGPAIAALVLWALAGLALTGFAVARARRPRVR